MRNFELFRITILILTVGLAAGCKQDFEPLAPAGEGTIVPGIPPTGDRVTILSAVPTGSVTVSPSSADQEFQVTAVSPRRRAILYTWSLETVAGGIVVAVTQERTGKFIFSPSGYSPTSYTLTVSATDGLTTDTRSWSVRINQSPTITTPSPTSPKKLSVDSTLNLTANVADADGDALAATWTLNGAVSASLVSGGIVAGVASATLTPDTTMIGDNTVVLSISDGITSTTQTWTVKVNYFSQACNELAAGQICTYVGPREKMDGSSPTDTSIRLNNIQGMDFDSAGNVIFVDALGVYAAIPGGPSVWVWNRSGAPVTYAGNTVASGQVAVVAGSGIQGVPVVGPSSAWEMTVYYTSGVAVDPTTNDIYVTGYAPGALGGLMKIAFGGSTYTMPLGATANYYQPRYKFLGGQRRLYVGNGTAYKIQYINLATNAVTDVVGTGVAGTGGDGGAAAAATVTQPHSIAFDSNDNMYFTEVGNCTVRVVCATTAAGICSGTPVDAGGTTILLTGGVGAAVAGNVYRFAGTGACAASSNDVAPTASALLYPYGIEVITGDHVVITEPYNARMKMINVSGAPLAYAGVTIAAQQIKSIAGAGYYGLGRDGLKAADDLFALYNSTNVREDPLTGNLLYGDSHAPGSYYSVAQLREIDAVTGIGTRKVGSGLSHCFPTTGYNLPSDEVNSCNAVAVAGTPDDKMFYVETYYGTVQEVAETGEVSLKGSAGTTTVPGMPIGNSGFNNVYMSADSLGNLFISNFYQLFFWNRATTSTTIVGQTVLSDYVAKLAGTGAVASNGDGGAALDAAVTTYPPTSDGTNLYLPGDHCIRKIDSSGIITTIAGTCGAGGLQGDDTVFAGGNLYSPSSVVVDSSGAIVTCESVHGYLRLLNTTGAAVTAFGLTANAGRMRTIAGAGGDYVTDGIAGPTASILCYSLAKDSVGNVYFASNGVVRKIVRDGVNAGKVYTISGYITSNYLGGVRYWRSTDEGGAAVNAKLGGINGISINSDDEMFVVTHYGGVKKIKLVVP